MASSKEDTIIVVERNEGGRYFVCVSVVQKLSAQEKERDWERDIYHATHRLCLLSIELLIESNGS